MPEQKKPVSLHGSRFKLAEYDRNLWSVEVENDLEPKEFASPMFWAHVAQKLRRGDRIEIMPENMSWYAELIVVDQGNTWAKTAPLRLVELESVKIDDVVLDGGRFKVEFAGKTTLYRVVEQSSKKVMKDKFRTPLEAQNWFNDWQKSQTVKAAI